MRDGQLADELEAAGKVSCRTVLFASEGHGSVEAVDVGSTWPSLAQHSCYPGVGGADGCV